MLTHPLKTLRFHAPNNLPARCEVFAGPYKYREHEWLFVAIQEAIAQNHAVYLTKSSQSTNMTATINLVRSGAAKKPQHPREIFLTLTESEAETQGVELQLFQQCSTFKECAKWVNLILKIGHQPVFVEGNGKTLTPGFIRKHLDQKNHKSKATQADGSDDTAEPILATNKPAGQAKTFDKITETSNVKNEPTT